jgi:hypothetical protein
VPVRTLADEGLVKADALMVGHVTIDRFDDGREALGGAALYGGLLYARAGLDAAIVTAGDPEVLAERMGVLADELEVLVLPAPSLTTFGLSGSGAGRVLRVLERAPDIPLVRAEAPIVHLGPVAAEIGPEWTEQDGLVGITPQGLVRRWGEDGVVHLYRRPGLEAYDADLVVLDEQEAKSAPALADSWRKGAVVAITRGDGPASVRRAEERLEVPALAVHAVDDTGAGDVFAAALLLALSEGRELEAAVRYAHAAAGLHVEGLGPGTVPTRAAVEARLSA